MIDKVKEYAIVGVVGSVVLHFLSSIWLPVAGVCVLAYGLAWAYAKWGNKVV